MNEAISVIIPVHNAEEYIAFVIDFVLAQSYSNWGLLTVDDCSTDLSVSLVGNYVEKDDRVHLLRTDKPSGSPCESRNIGMGYARGRYIAFLNSDSMQLPNKLGEQLRMSEGGEIVIVYSNYEETSKGGVRAERIVTVPLLAPYRDLLKGNVIGNLTGVYDVKKVGKIYCQNIHHEDCVL